MKMTMNALHAITLLVACFNAFLNAVASSVITEPPPQDLCDTDITIPDWKNYDVNNLKKRLQGKTLKVGCHWDPGFVHMCSEEGRRCKLPEVETPVYAQPYPQVVCTDCKQLDGLQVEILKAVAERGGYALNITRDFDIGGNWWTDLAVRRQKGMANGHYHTDVSRRLVVSKSIIKRTLRESFMSVLGFEPEVW